MKVFLAVVLGAFSVLFLANSAPAEAGSEKVIYAFCTGYCDGGNTDGILPEAGLIEKKGKLYGTTFGGGGTGPYCGVGGGGGCGTAFSVDPNSGTETILHAFGGQPNDGANPRAGFVVVNGKFYGTTAWGGAGSCTAGCGTIFSIDPTSGQENVLYSFQRFVAEQPGGLIKVKGTFYGTTSSGGKGGQCSESCGTIFSFDLSSDNEAVVHNFNYKKTGAETMASLLNLNGHLYGTTPIGGTHSYGTIFSVHPTTGHITTLYNFEGYDAPSPLANLINVNGTLYGTVTGGGSSNCCGAVISIDPTTGAVENLHEFCGQSCSDGANPIAGLINVGGILYGTTSFGGTGTCAEASEPAGCGTVFSIDLSTGSYSVLYSFQNNGTDGIEPWAPLIDVNGTLYGTTLTGGGGTGCGYGCGTVFSVTP